MFKYTFIPDHHRHKNACLLVAFNEDVFFLFSRSWSFGRLCVCIDFFGSFLRFADHMLLVRSASWLSCISEVQCLYWLWCSSWTRPSQNTRTTSIQSQRINPNTCSFPASSGGQTGCRSGGRASESLSSSLTLFYGFSESCRERNSLLILDLAEGEGRRRELSLAFPPCFLLSEKGF